MKTATINNRIRKRAIALALAGSALAPSASIWAMPSGLGNLPPGIIIPKENGQTIPVELLPHIDNPQTIYVKPLRGEFVSTSLLKSPLSNCGLVKEELKVSEINTAARVDLQQMLRQAQIDYKKNQQKFNEFSRKYEEAYALLQPLESSASELATDADKLFAQIKDAEEKVDSLSKLIAIESNSTKLAKLEADKKAAQEEVEAAKKKWISADSDAKAARKRARLQSTEVATWQGRKDGIGKTLTNQFENIGKIRTQMDALEEASQKVIQRYSERPGGYASYTADFAPSRYLAMLQSANPGKSFLYIPSLTGTVEAIIPEDAAEANAGHVQTGTMILAWKATDAGSARAKHPIAKHLLTPSEVSDWDPVKAGQAKSAQFENSLTGSKALAIKLSILGYCAMKEPESLASGNGEVPQVFKLAFYYTYPVNFDLEISGKYHAKAMLYDFYKVSSSSSWFGLSRKQRREHVQRYASSSFVDVKVKPRGIALSTQETFALAEKVREQVVYYALHPFLDLRAPQAPGNLAAEPPATGGALSDAGKRIMMIPTPWTFWGGLVLSSIGKMFGSSNYTSIEDLTKEQSSDLNYNLGFTFIMPGDLTIGDLQGQTAKIGNVNGEDL